MFIQLQSTDMKEIVKLMANEPLDKGVNTRTAIVTQGIKPVLVARTNNAKVEEFPVIPLEPDQILDVNGAGDAFTGGFLAQLVLDKPFEQCIKCAIYCASECIQRLGCTFPKEMKFGK